MIIFSQKEAADKVIQFPRFYIPLVCTNTCTRNSNQKQKDIKGITIEGVQYELSQYTDDIKEITIEGVQYKLSQYADYTTIFKDGSPSSLDGIIRILDYFLSLTHYQV